MILDELFAGRFQSYIEHILRRQVLWLFVHIPKTAGSSLNGELVPILSPSYHILIDYAQVGRQPFNVMLNESTDRFIEAARDKKYNYCTGHITTQQVRRIVAAVPNTCPMTLLREPVARFISDYRYQCSPMHPGHEQFVVRHPTILSYLEQRGECNKMAGHLVPRNLRLAGDPGPCIDHILEAYACLGIQEMYALSLRLITTLAGDPRRPTVAKRVNPMTPGEAPLYSDAVMARIGESNALDVAIYTDLAGRFAAIADALERFLDVVDPLPGVA